MGDDGTLALIARRDQLRAQLRARHAELRATAAEPVPWEQVKADLGLA